MPARVETPHPDTAAASASFGMFKNAEELVAYLETNRKMLVSYALKNDVTIHEFSDGFMKMTVSDKIHPDFIMNLHKILTEATGKEWKIDILRGHLGETIADRERAKTEEDKRSIMEYPLVKAIMAEFKGAKIETLTRRVDLEETADGEADSELFLKRKFNHDEYSRADEASPDDAEKMEEAQAKLAEQELTGTSGGGMVKITLNGKFEMKKVEIDKSMLEEEDVSILEDMIAAAYNDAHAKVDASMAEGMKDVTGGLNLGGLKLPF